jgi:hypothetical protein
MKILVVISSIVGFIVFVYVAVKVIEKMRDEFMS